MDERLANRLFEEGAFLFLLDVPIGTEVGIDFNCWRTAEKFKGIKMIPPGVHYVYYSAVDKQGCVAPRTGFFYNFNKKDVVVRRWNPETEEVINNCSHEETDVLKKNLQNLDKHLGPYPFEMWKKWLSLSSRITTAVIRKIESAPQKVPAVAELVETPVVNTGLPVKENILNSDDQLLAPRQENPLMALNFTEIPKNSFPKGSSAGDITKYSMDTSFVLQQMLSLWESPSELLAELQMVFLYFVIGQVYSAFEHWKHLTHIFCSADEMVSKNPSLIMEFIGDLYFQMQEVPTDFFVDIISSENFLVKTLRVLFANILENSEVDPQLKRRMIQFKQFVTQRFQWDFDAEPEDEAPMIVEMIENHM
ncbi:protein AAR2 homolog [Daphnia magna]|uniref:Protein AAR2 homolog n=1 Tax=Daphnia magna TaxID=35525 RepID=A0ABQ9Z478_9CRUS|nr:protein AAR2 homolog [Daphnia magna]KAK4007695.1 hypothetical protein OUZ56_012848 [Daphnia magna]